MKTERAETRDHARELFIQRHARYEVSPYYVVLDLRTFGVPPSQRRIQAGFDIDVYAAGPNHNSVLSFENGELRKTLNEISAACQETVAHGTVYSTIEIIPFEDTLVLNVKSHLEPEALVRIRIAHTRGLDQPAGEGEDKARAEVENSLAAIGVKRT